MPAPDSLSLPPSVSATEQVFAALYDAIISLDLPPGTKVSEAEIAKKLEVSRQPVRDAFYRLSEIGFMLIRPQRATTITYISERTLLDVRFIRTALEVECLRAAMSRITSAQIERLESLVAGQSACVARGDKLGFHDLDDKFHKAICEIAGHSHAWALIRDQKAHLDRVRFLSLTHGAQSALDEHRQILDGIKAGDLDGAEACLRQHLSNIERILDQVRDANSEYFAET